MPFHLYTINELYSNADGSVQFIELAVGPFNGEGFRTGHALTASQGGVTRSYTFMADLPSQATANTTVLVATQGFANLGIVAPDYIVPAGFLFTNGGTVNFAGVDAVSYTALPTNGTQSIDRNGTPGTNSPRNFAGATGTVQSSTIVTGTGLSETLTGSAAENTIVAFGGNDVMIGGGGNDTLDGGSGIDRAVYAGPRANYTVAAGGGQVTDRVGAEGTDVLIGVERISFSDGNLAFDLGRGESAGNTVRLLGAAFSPAAIAQNPGAVRAGIDIFDAGFQLPQVSALVLRTPAFLALAGGASNEQFVNAVYLNVVGSPLSSDAERSQLLAFLQGSGGSLSQADFLAIVANLPVNENHIGLAGLQQSGVLFV